MAKAAPMTGRRICGAVTLSATPKAVEAAACHREMCRNWSGAA